MKTMRSFLPRTATAVSLVSTSLFLAACGGGNDNSAASTSSSSSSSTSQEKAESSVSSSIKPTMKNMTNAVVDAMQTISADTVEELTGLAKAGEAIEIPESMSKVRTALETAGKSDLFKGFSSSLNETAASALSGYKDNVKSMIGSLSIPDVGEVIEGGEGSITRYVENKVGAQLEENLIPLVKNAVKDTAAGDWVEKIKAALPENTGGLLGKVSEATGVSIPTDFNVENHVTDGIMDKFFNVMAEQEAKFRADPKGSFAELFNKIMQAGQ